MIKGRVRKTNDGRWVLECRSRPVVSHSGLSQWFITVVYHSGLSQWFITVVYHSPSCFKREHDVRDCCSQY
jgi:hypothetical protein